MFQGRYHQQLSLNEYGFLVDQVEINIFSYIYIASQWPINISPKEQAYPTPQPSVVEINSS